MKEGSHVEEKNKNVLTCFRTNFFYVISLWIFSKDFSTLYEKVNKHYGHVYWLDNIYLFFYVYDVGDGD